MSLRSVKSSEIRTDELLKYWEYRLAIVLNEARSVPCCLFYVVGYCVVHYYKQSHVFNLLNEMSYLRIPGLYDGHMHQREKII